MTRFNLNIPHTLMRSEPAKARLSDDFVPVHHDVDSHCREGSALLLKNAALEVVVYYSPFTRGGKLGLVKALKSADDIFETLLPRKTV